MKPDEKAILIKDVFMPMLGLCEGRIYKADVGDGFASDSEFLEELENA